MPTLPPDIPSPSSRGTWWLIRLLVLAYAFNAFSLITPDNDLWGKIAFGNQIWSAGSIPLTNDHSFTAADYPFYNHEWLADVIFYLIFSTWGSTGLLIFKMAIGLMVVNLLSSLYLRRGKSVIVYLFYFFFLIPVLAPGFMSRAHLFTILFLTLLVALLQYYYDGHKKTIYWIPPLILIWVNCHGGVLAGMGIFGAVTGVEWLRGRFKKESRGTPLLYVFLLSCAALFINPYGYKLLLFLKETLSLPRQIGEWYPVPILNTSFMEFKIIAILFILTIILPIKKRVWEIVIAAIAMVYAFKHQRHTVLAAVVVTPHIPVVLTHASKRWLTSLQKIQISPGLQIFFHILLVLLIGINLVMGLQKNAANGFKIIVEPQIYPSYAVQFMRANKVQGNIWVPFDWGDYIIYKLPESKVSIDGRFRAAYPMDVLDEHWRFIEGRPGWESVLEKYHTDYILTRRKDRTHVRLDRHPDWLKIYQDPIAFLYVRKTEPPGSIENQFIKNQLNQPKDPPSFDFP